MNTKNLKITVSSPNLDRINFKGVGNINIENKLTTNTLDIESKGVGNIEIQDLSCQNLTVSSMGVGNVNLKGKAESANLYSKGVGDVEATNLGSYSRESFFPRSRKYIMQCCRVIGRRSKRCRKYPL